MTNIDSETFFYLDCFFCKKIKYLSQNIFYLCILLTIEY